MISINKTKHSNLPGFHIANKGAENFLHSWKTSVVQLLWTARRALCYRYEIIGCVIVSEYY